MAGHLKQNKDFEMVKRKSTFKRFYRQRWRNPLLVSLSALFVIGYFSMGQITTLGTFLSKVSFQSDSIKGSSIKAPISRHLLADDQNKTAQFPEDLFTLEQRRHGAVLFHVIGLTYMFVALAIVCDEFFVPSLDVITEKAQISEDVAGATFMAAGGSAPELFTSIIGVFISYDDVGIGTIVGSAVFNILFVISMCAIFSKTVLELTWWPLFRDVSFYSTILILLMTFFQDSVIYWWEALVLLCCYFCYVTFMKFNEHCEKFVKKLVNRNKVTRVGSADKLMPHMTKRKMSTPMLHAGSKFRSGLLQLMIHTIDPMHDGKLDEKANQLHAIASLRVLLEAQKANGAVAMKLNQGKGVPNSMSCPACADCPDCTHGGHPSMVESPSGMHIVPTNVGEVNAEEHMPPVENSPTSNVRVIWTANNSAGTFMTRSVRSDPGEGTVLRTDSVNSIPQSNADSTQNVNIVMPSDSKNNIQNSNQNIPHSNSAGSQPPEPVPEDEEEDEKPLDLSWPDTWHKRLNYVLLAPIIYPLYLTLPDTRKPEKRKYFVITFVGSILWIAVFSYLMVWWASLVGETAGIPNEVMGLTFLAAGTSIPDLITSVLVARKGFGDMAVSSSVGSNIFDVSVGLPLPWFLSCLIFGPVEVSSSGMACSLLLLFLMLLFVIISIAAFKWKMNVGLAMVMFLLYFVFIACSLLLEYGVVDCDALLGKSE
ncbi:sodium/potassium/calcium exchanger 2-like [Argiope bruennichi]|uniref:Sodium/potassium/calcium exchanger Nckx30C like protein n=1 Tax=Argiope bruennichi TaxID=94029 RepID=A0A8T0FUW3_ARGBR|nr:sodium/potassium/calcium exchanger 2-like [Argiope bruennichi]KAF8794894.1 Sodium/potassium/calcium exchanger Nckx30C like protein [Argiope bruennichi]